MREGHRVTSLAFVGLASLLALFSRVLLADCTVSTTPVAFGSYSIFDTSPLDSTGTITVSCTNPYNAPVNVKISAGLSFSFTPRKQKNGTHELAYNLFLEASRTTIWGDGTSPTSYATPSPASGTPLELTVYGRIPERQTSAYAGSYSDTLVVTVEF